MSFAKIRPVPEACALNAVLYCRFSSDRQKENSIDFQLRADREYCERKGLKVVGEYIDRALTGTNDNRPRTGFRASLAHVFIKKVEIGY